MRKQFRSILVITTFVLAAILLGFGLAANTSSAADHLDAPLVQKDGRVDINDLYAFTNGSNSVMVMTVNPVAGALNPTTLRSGTHYEFAIDNDGDAVEEVVYRLQASAPNGNGKQNIILHRDGGERDEAGKIIARGKSEKTIEVADGGSLFVGLRDDPFFFDLAGFQNGLAFCQTDPGPDFFAGLNVTAIVLEVPTDSLTDGYPAIGVWARTTIDDEVVERMGRPAINTVLIPSGSKNAFNATHPSDDVTTWTDTIVASLVALNGDQAYSKAAASILLPDILTIDTSQASGFLNGRTLSDDVIDTALSVVSKGALTTDCVYGNDVLFLNAFPYLARPHMSMTASSK